VFASKRYNKNMEWGYVLQERHSASQPCRQKLPLRFLVGPGDEMGRVGFFVEAVAGSYPKIDQPVQLTLSLKSPTMLATRYWFVPVRSRLNGSNERSSVAALKASGAKKRVMVLRVKFIRHLFG
jgi:hypothetical protein